jgi:hypothetical protein
MLILALTTDNLYYRFIIPDYISNLQPQATAFKSPPFFYTLPKIGENKVYMHSRLYNPLHDRQPIKSSQHTRFSNATIYYRHSLQLNRFRIAEIAASKAAGAKSYRFNGKNKIVEVFHSITLSELVVGSSVMDMDAALIDAESYEEIPAGYSCFAFDSTMQPLVVHFADAYERVWGRQIGQEILKQTTENIDTVIQFQRPNPPFQDKRHKTHYSSFIQESSDDIWAQGPQSRSGILYYGIWKEQGHSHWPTILTKDLRGGTQARAGSLARELFHSFGNITNTWRYCFKAADRVLYQEYKKHFKSINATSTDKTAASTVDDEFLSLRILLINLLTEPHCDDGDLADGFAWLSTFGIFTGGLFGISLLRRRFSFQPGSYLGIRGAKLQHFTTKWKGTNRYCLVGAFHTNMCI